MGGKYCDRISKSMCVESLRQWEYHEMPYKKHSQPALTIYCGGAPGKQETKEVL
jgi:hypothetical protein